MLTEERTADSGGLIQLPAGYEIAVEPTAGTKLYPVTAYLNNDRGRPQTLNNARTHRFGPWSALTLDLGPGGAGGSLWVMMTTTETERIGDADGRWQRAVRLWQTKVEPGGVLAVDEYALQTMTSGATSRQDPTDVRRCSRFLLKVAHKAITGVDPPVVTAKAHLLDSVDSLDASPLGAKTFSLTLNNTPNEDGLQLFEFGLGVGEETSASVIRRGMVWPHLGATLQVENSDATFTDGLVAELWGWP